MEIAIFLARFWGSLFILLGVSIMGAGFLGRVIRYTEERAITVSTGYITLLLGLATVVLHTVWVADWRIALTLLGWITLLKGMEKVVFPERVSTIAQKFKASQAVWGAIIFMIGAWFLAMSILNE